MSLKYEPSSEPLHIYAMKSFAHRGTAAPGWYIRCQVNLAHVGQSRPGSGHGVKVKFLKTFQVISSSLGIELQVEIYEVILSRRVFVIYTRCVHLFDRFVPDTVLQ